MSVPALALDPSVRLTQYHTLSFQIEQGLPQNSVQALLQTRDGYLWLGTQAGLVRFDGVRFVGVRPIHGAGVHPRERPRARRGRATAPSGLRTDDGLLSLRDGPVQPLRRAATGCRRSRSARSWWRSDGTLWVGTEAGVCRLKNGRLARARSSCPGTESVSATKITQTRDGAIWASSADRALSRRRTRGIERYAEQQGLPADAVFDAYEDRDGTLWVGTSRGLAKFDGRRFTRVPLPVDDSVHAVFEDREGAMWLGLERRGDRRACYRRPHRGLRHRRGARRQLRRSTSSRTSRGTSGSGCFDAGLTCLRQTPFSGFGVREGLPSNDLQAILQTRSGEIWLGTNTAGLTRLADGRLDDLHDEGRPARRRDHVAGREPRRRRLDRHAARPLPDRRRDA